MLILSRFRRNRHHALSQTQPRLTTPPASAEVFTAADWIDLQLLAGKTITLQSLANENRLAAGLWQWRLFIDTEADRRIMARLERRHLIVATNTEHTCASHAARRHAPLSPLSPCAAGRDNSPGSTRDARPCAQP